MLAMLGFPKNPVIQGDFAAVVNCGPFGRGQAPIDGEPAAEFSSVTSKGAQVAGLALTEVRRELRSTTVGTIVEADPSVHLGLASCLSGCCDEPYTKLFPSGEGSLKSTCKLGGTL